MGYIIINELNIYRSINIILWFILLLGFIQNIYEINDIIKTINKNNRKRLKNKNLEILIYRKNIMLLGIIMSLLQIFKFIFDARLGIIPFEIPLIIDEFAIWILYVQALIFITFIVCLTKLETNINSNLNLSKRSTTIIAGIAFIPLVLLPPFKYIFIEYLGIFDIFKFGILTINTLVMFIYSTRKCYLLDLQLSGIHTTKSNNNNNNNTNSIRIKHTSLDLQSKHSSIDRKNKHRSEKVKNSFKKMQKQFRIKTAVFNFIILAFVGLCLEFLIRLLRRESYFDISYIGILQLSYNYKFSIKIFDIAYFLGEVTLLFQFIKLNIFNCNNNKNNKSSSNKNNKSTIAIKSTTTTGILPLSSSLSNDE